MPLRRQPATVVAPPAPIPEPRPDFRQAADDLAPIHHDDFSVHPASFGTLDQRLSVLSLVLRLDARNRSPKYSAEAKHVVEWIYPRLSQLETLSPFHRGDIYFLVQLAPSGSALSRRTQDLVVDFILCENLDNFVHVPVRASSIYPAALVLSWGGGSDSLKAANTLPMGTLAAAALFVTDHSRINGGRLIGDTTTFYSHDKVDFGPQARSPVSLNEAIVLSDDIQEAFDKVYPGVKVHLAGGHAAGRAACVDIRLVVAVPVEHGPVDPEIVLDRLKPALTSKNALQPSRWILSPSSPWDDHDYPLPFLGSARPLSIGTWRFKDMGRTSINLLVVPANQAGAAQLVWTSPSAWLASFAHDLEERKGYRLTAAGAVPRRDGLPEVALPTEADVFALLDLPLKNPQARQCTFSSAPHLSFDGASISVKHYAPGGPIFSPSTPNAPSPTMSPSAGLLLIGRRLTPQGPRQVGPA